VTPTVTGLRERKRGRVAVELDGRPWRVLPADAVVRAGLTVGRRLDRPAARELAREVRRARALAQATRTLATSGRSRGELDQRLARAGHAGAAREEALATLDRAGLVDDVRLAHNRAEALARRGYGDAAIRADLGKRSIPAEAVSEAVSGLEPEAERARRILDGEFPEAKTLRRLAGRGFSRETLEEIGSAFAREP
jgi:SOS response regulatory protein OraA/RecX